MAVKQVAVAMHTTSIYEYRGTTNLSLFSTRCRVANCNSLIPTYVYGVGVASIRRIGMRRAAANWRVCASIISSASCNTLTHNYTLAKPIALPVIIGSYELLVLFTEL